MARIISWKLLRIGGRLIEKEELTPRDEVLNFLDRREREAAYASTAENFILQLSQGEIVAETHSKASTISNIFKYMKDHGLKYENGTITVPHTGFFRGLLDAETPRRGRPPGTTSSKKSLVKKEEE